jgi:hypothetical protein
MAGLTTPRRTHSGCTVHACMHALRLRCRFHLLGCTVFVPLSYLKHSGAPCCTVPHTDTFWLRIQGKLGFAKCVREHLKDARNRRVAIGRAPRSQCSPRAHPHARAWSASLPFGASLAVFAWARGAARSAWGHVSSALGAVLTRPPETYVLLAGHAATAEVRARAHSPGGEAARGSLHEALAHCGARIRFAWLSVC